MTFDLIVDNAVLANDGGTQSIAVRHGRIAALMDSAQSASATHRFDAGGNAVIPGLADMHVHLDKTYFPLANASGTLDEAVRTWIANGHQRNRAECTVRATRAVENAIAHGVTAMRTHVNTLDMADMQTVAAVLDVRDKYRSAIDLQLVALGHAGGGSAYDDATREAMRMGVDIVGNAPQFTKDGKAALRGTFEMAAALGVPMDIHIDENHDPGSRELEWLADMTIEFGMQGRVTAGHCCSLAFMQPEDAARIIAKVRAADIHIVSLPSCNLVLQGRMPHPQPRGLTRVKELMAAGINVSFGSDNVRDPFNPFGSYDTLMAAHIGAHAAHLTGSAELDEALAMVTQNPRRAMALPAAGLKPGDVADFVVLHASLPQDGVLWVPPRHAVFKAGRLVCKTELQRTLSI